MLSVEDRRQLEADRRLVGEFWAGERSRPLVIENREAYCAWDVVCPTAGAYLEMMVRYAGLRCAALMPLSSLKVICYRLMGVHIGRGVWISPGVLIDPLYPALIELDDDVLLGMGCRVFTHERTATNFRIGRVRVGKGSVIGAFATLRAGVTIGRNVTVGFNSYVNKDVPDGAVVGGVPARLLRAGEAHD